MLQSLLARRVRHHITKGGVLFVLALLLTGAGAFLSANNLLFLVFSSMLALLLVSGFLSRLVLAGLELELLLPRDVWALTAARARIRIRNLKYFTPSFSIELAGRRHPDTDAPSILTTPVYFPLITGRSFVETAVEVRFPSRGIHSANLFVLSTKFPFGFLRKSASVTLHRETVVYPSQEPVGDAEALLEQLAGEFDTHSRGAGLEFYRIRPYETTDSARLVDWKSTAHTGSLQVREFARDEERAVEIYLDRYVPADHVLQEKALWFEAAVQKCAFLASHLASRDIEVTLRSQGEPGLGTVFGILHFLALVQPLAVGKRDGAEETNGVEAPFDPVGTRIAFSLRPAAFEKAGWRVVAD